jgi:2-dehydropantoate 2-reductase
MLQDVLNGRSTEIDAICGAIVRLGHEHGVPVPTNELLLRLIEANAPGR